MLFLSSVPDDRIKVIGQNLSIATVLSGTFQLSMAMRTSNRGITRSSFGHWIYL
jgi:hypothetical protein